MTHEMIEADPNDLEELLKDLEEWAPAMEFGAQRLGEGDLSVAFKIAANRMRVAASMLRDMSAREKALREALEPFAKEAAEWSGNGIERPDDQVVEIGEPGFDGALALFNLGDLRRAAKALEAK